MISNKGLGTVTVSGGVFSHNSAEFYGGVAASSSGSVTINAGEFSDNAATTGHGGALYLDDAAADILGGTFYQNNAHDSGGAIYVAASTVHLGAVTFEGNVARYGGAIANDGGTIIDADPDADPVTVKTFTGNSAKRNTGTEEEPVWIGDGGAIANNGSINLTNALFTGNNTVGKGGAVDNWAGSTAVFTDGTFKGNTAKDGGVFYASVGAVITVDGGTFGGTNETNPENFGNSAIDGGVFYLHGATAYVNDGTFNWNSASQDGAVCSMTDHIEGADPDTDADAALNIIDGSFAHNRAVKGGVVYAYANPASVSGVTVTITDGEFSNNTAQSGGVVCSDYGTITISDGEFSNNTAQSGGVVCSDSGTITVGGGEFSDNTSTGHGGVLYLFDTTANISGGTFADNTAVNNGGALYADSKTISISNGDFSGNTAGGSGGALWLFGTTANIGGVFSQNTAVTNGGAVYAESGTIAVSGGEFSDNTAGSGGAFCLTYTTADILGGTFRRNTASTYGGAVYATGDTVHLGAVTMENNRARNGGALANNQSMITDANPTAVKTFTGNGAKFNAGTEEEPDWTGNGGAIFNKGTIELSNTLFSQNYSAGNGGAVDNLATGTLTLTGARFSGNSALAGAVSVGSVDWAGLDLHAGDGGALQNWGAAKLVDAYFTGNSAHDGGAIANGKEATLTLSQTTASSNNTPLGFAGNAAVYGGAIINVGKLTRTAEEDALITFTGNSSYINGGAISNSNNNGTVTAGSLELYDTLFKANTAGSAVEGNTHTGSGGAIVSAKTLMITSSYFTDNIAVGGGKGGAVDQVAGTLTLIGDRFTGNSASGGFGGAVNTWTGGTIAGVFTGNSAKFGGAVSVLGNDTPTTITGATFEENIAASYGGALYASGTVMIDGAHITANGASLGGGVMAITSNISSDQPPQKGRGKIIFAGAQTIFSGNTTTQNIGNDICASSSNSAEGDGAVVEIVTVPSFSGGTGYDLAVDRSILVMAENTALPQSLNVYSSKEFTCGYTYDASTLTFTSLTSNSRFNKWRIYWSGSDTGPDSYTEYTAGGAVLPSGTVTSGTAVLIEASRGGSWMKYYLLPTVNNTASGASEALFDEALFDDTEAFEGSAPQNTALEEYCDECYL